MQYFIVDAFADQLFQGNQAGVCLLEEWLDAELLQSIAAETSMLRIVVSADGGGAGGGAGGGGAASST